MNSPSNQKIECPVPGCGYNENMRDYDAALARPLSLETTRSNANVDAHRDMDGFDEDEELARLRRAVAEAKRVSPTENSDLYRFIAEAFGNIDELLQRLGPLPHAWIGSAREWVGTESRLRSVGGDGVEDEEMDVKAEPEDDDHVPT